MTIEREHLPAETVDEAPMVRTAGDEAVRQAPSGPRPPAAETLAKWTIGSLLLLAIMALCFGLGYGVRMATNGSGLGLPGSAATSRASGAPDFSVLNEIYSDLKKDYIDPNALDAKALRQGAIDGLIKAVGDAHMGYLSQAAFLSEGDDVTGSFSGIGATVQQKNGELILAPLPDTPAQRAGVKPDDTLVAVNGAPTKGWSDLQAVAKIRGPKGSTVKLTVKHATGQQVELSIQRDTINIDSVRTVDLHDADGKSVTDVGYVQILQFTQRTPQEMQKYLDSIQGKNYKGLVIDLRNNPGGVVDSVVKVAGDFVGHDPAVIVQSKDGSEETIRPSNTAVTQLPLAVLVNHNSASAAEILSGALRDDRHAKIFGESTFGKGTENIFVPLKSDPGGISITVGRWLTPSHLSIEGTGLKPDVAVSAADNEDPNGQFNAVLYRAISSLENGGYSEGHISSTS